MEKQTKNIITRSFVKDQLRFYNTADIRSTLILCVALSVFFLPLTIASIWATVTLLKNIFLKIILSILVGALLSAPIWSNLPSLYRSLNERKLLNNDDFDIVTRTVLYKSEKMVYRHMGKFLHFQGFNEIAVNYTIFQQTTEGDAFYIVHYRTQKNIKLLYFSKMYEYK
ncbi:MAG: hypothetical protein J6Q82_06420 [Clostridia bacterium]|nr:hypothetical protein [Clostridia bacterium]